MHVLTDPDSNITTFTYNAIGEQTEVTSPSVNSGSGVSSTTEYDADGEVIETTDADGRQTTYSYDSLGRPDRRDLAQRRGRRDLHGDIHL